MSRPTTNNNSPNRRNFLGTSAAVAAGGAVLGSLGLARSAHAAGSDIIKIALIGCGGRGTVAAQDAAQADPGIRLTAMADLFPDRLASSRKTLQDKLGEKYAVADDHCFTGFNAYKQVMESDVNVVLLTTPPHFRPMMLKAAIAAGKHVFCEKPVAVDAPGCRSVFETVEEAKKKDLSIVSGLCWRYDLGVRETMKKIKDGAIGEILSIQENYLTGTLWQVPRTPKMSEMEYQCRNWLYYTWLSGDHIVEQHIHSLDKGLWLNNDNPPVAAYGLGGRQARTGPEYGNAYDHFAVVYEFPNNVKVHSYTRQMAKCWPEVEDHVIGTKGRAKVLDNSITGETSWKYSGPKPNMYKVEHDELFAGIRSGKHLNNGTYMTRSTLMAIMGRMVCYTGKRLTWDECLNSSEDLTPPTYEFVDIPVPEIAVPGETKFA